MKPRSFQCKSIRPVKKETLEKETCTKLKQRWDCYGIPIEKRDKKGIRRELNPQEVQRTNNLLATFEKINDVISEKQCPLVLPISMKKILEEEFPKHYFKMGYNNTIYLPYNFTPEEITILEKDLPTLSHTFYKLHYNERLGKYYISPKKK